MKGRVIFKTENCKGCRLCVEACPVHILKIDPETINAIGYNPAYNAEPEKCIACANCALMCPDSIITVERMDV